MNEGSLPEVRGDSVEGSRPNQLIRGRIPQPVQLQILAMHQQGMSVEAIALATNRSISSIQKLVESGSGETPAFYDPPAPQNSSWELDDVVEFLSECPEDLVEGLLQLARLTREQTQLRRTLERRLESE